MNAKGIVIESPQLPGVVAIMEPAVEIIEPMKQAPLTPLAE